jgi:hypothetical protein
MQLEDYGFCGIGESGPFVADGNIRWPGGRLPVNTHGGNLSEAYIIGMTHIREAVEQLRGVAQQHLAGRRQRHAAWVPYEERGADLALDRLDLPAQARRGDVQPVGRAAEVELLGDRHEVPHLPQLHLFIVRAVTGGTRSEHSGNP